MPAQDDVITFRTRQEQRLAAAIATVEEVVLRGEDVGIVHRAISKQRIGAVHDSQVDSLIRT